MIKYTPMQCSLPFIYVYSLSLFSQQCVACTGCGLKPYSVHCMYARPAGTAIGSASDEPTPMASEHPADVGAH